MLGIDDHGGRGPLAVDIIPVGSGAHKTAPDAADPSLDGPGRANGDAAAAAETGSRDDDESQQQQQQQRSLSERDLDQLWQWNAVVPETIRRCIHDIISEQAAQRPQDVAVQSWDGSLTYAELERLSTQLALHLRFLGVDVGLTVPLCFEKSKWTVVALLAVMKAGAAFSLTDPSQPEARLRTIVEQTGAKLLVTSALQSSLGARIAPGAAVVAVSQATFDAPLPQQSSDPLPRVPSSALMYVIFTSGSTGRPKGVSISHENFTSGAVPRAEAVGYKSTSRVFDFPSYAFDVSIDCMLCTLACGGRVCVPSEQGRMDDLSGSIRDSKANMVHMTPSVARVLDPDIIPSLDVLGLGGEVVSGSDAATWRQFTHLIIGYGPSECTVGCTVNNNTSVSTGIGKGVGCVMWLVDPQDHNVLVPVGQVGELLIEGPVVGIGYLGEPAKTAEVFIEDPAWLTAGHGSYAGRRGRMYKTGDLVRYEDNLSGSIEFIGRKDQQVKIRGQRVELTEVEHHIQTCLPAGVKVVAEVIKPENASPALVAFLAEKSCAGSQDGSLFVDASPELSAALDKIDATLGAKVPKYMIPAAFVTLASMPTMVSMKTDRKRLREIGMSIPRSKLGATTHADDGPHEEPETDAEKKLARAWQLVLAMSSSPVYKASSFFGLGGDSLRAMKLVSAAREQALGLTVADIFTHPTLSAMASKTRSISSSATQDQVEPFSLLQQQGWEAQTARKDVAELCGIEPEQVEDVYPCTPLQEGLMALSSKVKEAYIAQRVVVLEDLETAKRLMAAYDEASRGSAILRTRIVQVPRRGLMQVVVNRKLEYTTGNDVAAYLASDRETPMDLGTALWRYAIITDDAAGTGTGTGTVSFVLTMHHALYDGWSMPLVVERINQAYQHPGKPLSRPSEFKHFIKYLLSQDAAESEAYWRAQLDGAHRLQFPLLPHQGYQAAADELLEEYVPLERLPGKATVATLIRGAWAIVASQYINSTDVVFGETLTGRNAPVVGVDEIEGPMITTVPLRVPVDPHAQVGEFLQAIQEQTVGQIPHEHFGLQHIRRLSPDAREACELRTGLVLHPSADTAAPEADATLPANNLIPHLAAREALKFNTFALMLVCSMDPKGFQVMASFDSKMVDRSTMRRALAQFKSVAQQLAQSSTTTLLGNVRALSDDDAAALRDAVAAAQEDPVVKTYDGASAAYIVQSDDASKMVPVGAIGELAIQTSQPKDLPTLAVPSWLAELLPASAPPTDALCLTGTLARYDAAGKIQVLGDKASLTASTDASAAAARKPRVSATSQRQRRLRALWSHVLRTPETEIGLDDSFFLLGGDSISAMKLASEARPEGIRLTVAQIFSHKTLAEMAAVMECAEEESGSTAATAAAAAEAPIAPIAEPFELLDGFVDDKSAFLANVVKPQLQDASWTVSNVLPTRFLQELTVRATISKPRFAVRYELIFFDGPVDLPRLRQSCQRLVAHNEILRTVYVESADDRIYAAVLDALETPFEEFAYTNPAVDLSTFTKDTCRADVDKPQPLGSSFVKWLYVADPQRPAARSCLVFRMSHAQYDEMCLPIMLRQLSALYAHDKTPEPSVPFSAYVSHVMRTAVPASLPYWRELLAGSTITSFRPDIPITDRRHAAIAQTVDISARTRDVTLASLPTATWALCLARRRALRDVVFGEVVSGRNVGLPGAESIAGPCWQYVPLRVRFAASWTGHDLLAFVQRQHVESAGHEAVSLREIADRCGLGWEKQASMPGDERPAQWWFDTVCHQDVSHVKERENTREEAQTRYETLYTDEEPLREWKIQTYVRDGGNSVVLEVVTFKSWEEHGRGLLADLVKAMEQLVHRPGEKLFLD
ncbi:hypothetical protein MY4824_002877 [Beauveria thailandica]